MASGICFIRLEDLKQQADEFGQEEKEKTMFLEEEWQKIQDAKLEKSNLKKKQSKIEF